jgi:hypothetical protein
VEQFKCNAVLLRSVLLCAVLLVVHTVWLLPAEPEEVPSQQCSRGTTNRQLWQAGLLRAQHQVLHTCAHVACMTQLIADSINTSWGPDKHMAQLCKSQQQCTDSSAQQQG